MKEDHPDLALKILEQAVLGPLQLVQPPHFLAEVAAVLARLKPDDASDDLLDLLNIERQTLDTPEMYATALKLAHPRGRALVPETRTKASGIRCGRP